MDRLKISSLTIAAMGLLCVCQHSAYSQAPLVLEQLQPTPQSSAQLVAQPLPTGNIELEVIARQKEAQARGKDLTIVPINQAIRPQELKRGKLSVDKMIRQPTDHASLFPRVSADHSFDNNAPIAPESRGIDGADYWTNLGYWWQSPAFCHKPLYFEQPCLERYGRKPTCTLLTPAASATKFFADFAVLPARMIYQHPHSKVSTLGYGRPGDSRSR